MTFGSDDSNDSHSTIALNLRRITDSLPALIHTARPDGHIDFFNRPWLEYVGLRLEDLEGWKWTASIHPDDRDGILEKWRASLASGSLSCMKPAFGELTVNTVGCFTIKSRCVMKMERSSSGTDRAPIFMR